jgi:hypoxanthine phosphoribosyltransferase
LLPLLRFPLTFDYLHATRYDGSTRGGEIKWKVAPRQPVSGRVVLVLDDILDEGTTLRHVVEACRVDGALSVHTAVLVAKDRPHEIAADIVGLEAPNRYLYGCGLDYKGYFRNVPAIYAVADEDV